MHALVVNSDCIARINSLCSNDKKYGYKKVCVFCNINRKHRELMLRKPKHNG